MDKIFDEVAKTLMYKGPEMKSIIQQAIENDLEYHLNTSENESLILFVTSDYPYDITVIDEFHYDQKGYLIQHHIVINGKRKEIFNKYKEATELLESIEANTLIAI